MAEECVHYCGKAGVFPKRPSNRPGLSRIGYRIGSYADFREAIFREINASTPLQAWTHRGADDPGVALLESAAIVGDILTFYQEHYANEAFLRTAAWRESVSDLVRLLGYRLTPAVGGLATFAIELKGDQPVTVPAGFPLKADLEEVKDPVNFQTEEELVARPHLGRFNLYRPRMYGSTVGAGTRKLELATAAGLSTPAALAAVGLKKGDKILLMPGEAMWSSAGAAYENQQAAQTVTVSKVATVLDRVVVEFDGVIAESWTAPVRAFRLGRSFKHFGNNAPATYTQSKKSGSEIVGAYEYATGFLRGLDHSCSEHSIARNGGGLYLDENKVPLDQEVNDLSTGNWVVLLGMVRRGAIGSADRSRMTVARRVAATTSATLSCGSLNGPSTIVELVEDVLRNTTATPSCYADFRDFRVLETTSAELTFRNVAAAPGGGFPASTSALYYYGSREQALTLAGRRLFLQHENGDQARLVCTSPVTAFPSGSGEDTAKVWALDFDQALPLVREDFDEEKPAVTVFGNLVDATQGKAETETVLGNGDGRLAFQTFKIPKTPLTYLTREGATPPEVPELQVYVNGRLWTLVNSFFGRGPKEEIYIVREDAGGTSYVQFGDGETGARLPSGLKNVTARYRSGTGAFGPVKAGASPSAGQRLDTLKKVTLPGIVTGGTEAEDAETAREAAPARLQSLGRLVSLRDYESEAMTFPGVTTVTAAWGLDNHVPKVLLRVLMQAGREAEFNAIRDLIMQAQICRGPNRFAVVVQQAFLRYVYLDLEYSRDPALKQEDVEASIRGALGLVGAAAHARSGLFGLKQRRLGESEYTSRVEAVIQNTPGVRWCKATAFGRLFGVADPATAPLPASPRGLQAKLNCPARRLLQLHSNHLTMASVANPNGDPCA